MNSKNSMSQTMKPTSIVRRLGQEIKKRGKYRVWISVIDKTGKVIQGRYRGCYKQEIYKNQRTGKILHTTMDYIYCPDWVELHSVTQNLIISPKYGKTQLVNLLDIVHLSIIEKGWEIK